MSKNKVLISDKLNPLAVEIFEKNGIEVDFKPGLSAEELSGLIANYDGLAIRSATTVTADILSKAQKLRVVGRAGIGTDNIDKTAATAKGVIVMNTPYGNSITTAEHAIAMMFALARQIPQANQSTHDGKWEKSKFMGVELYAKTLGVIGCGNIGAIVAGRARALEMNVIAFDPFLTDERAEELGIQKVSLEDLLDRADFITLHTPLTDQTRNILNKDTLARTKKGVRIINCARGGLIDEAALKEALDCGHVAGAALDVFEVEPAKDNPLFGHPNVICTPHLGASTTEAQVNVAIQVAEQMSDYLTNGAVTNALNMPSISAEDAPKLKPYMALSEQIGSFAGQITENAIKTIRIEYRGTVAGLDSRPLNAIVIANLLRPQLEDINMVNALSAAKARGIEILETKSDDDQDFSTAMTLSVITDKRERSITGTLFAGKQPRIVQIEGVPVEAALTRHMLFIRNLDRPGVIGRIGSILGEAGHNIADFRLGRADDPDQAQNSAICLVSLDKDISPDLLNTLIADPDITMVRQLKF